MNSYIPSLARGLKSVAKKDVDGLCHDKHKAADRKEAKSGALMHEVVAGLPIEHKQLGRAQIETKVNPRADARTTRNSNASPSTPAARLLDDIDPLSDSDYEEDEA